MLFNPSHPGEVLKDYLGDMTVKEAARRLGVTRPNLSRILNGRAGISAVMSVGLAKAMPYTSPEFWLKMQLNYDLSNRFRPPHRSVPQRGYDIAEDGQHFDCATWLHKARKLSKEDFRREAEKELTGRETEPREIMYQDLQKPDPGHRAGT